MLEVEPIQTLFDLGRKNSTRLGQNLVYGWTVSGQGAKMWFICYRVSKWCDMNSWI